MRSRTTHLPRRLAPALTGAVAAAAVGLGCGAALRPTTGESGLPRPPQLVHLTDAELATFERTPRLVWPSVPAPWRS